MSTWGKLNLEGSKNVKGVNVKMEVESNVERGLRGVSIVTNVLRLEGMTTHQCCGEGFVVKKE